MAMVKNVLLALLSLTLLTACESSRSLETLRIAAPAGDAYQKALAASYRDEAENRALAYDWGASEYFAHKGLAAAYGHDVEPEDPAVWGLSSSALADFTAARGKLLAAINHNRSTQPELTASAVLAYDRWLVAEHSRLEASAVQEQRGLFEAILTKLEEAHVDSSVTTTSDAAPAPIAKSPTTPDENVVVLYFPFDSARLGDSAKGALAQLMRAVGTKNEGTVSINGHADRAGSEEYNLKLSERRARYVLHELEKAGVPSKRMKYFAFGETDPAVATEDGVPEPKNRRVEVFLE